LKLKSPVLQKQTDVRHSESFLAVLNDIDLASGIQNGRNQLICRRRFFAPLLKGVDDQWLHFGRSSAQHIDSRLGRELERRDKGVEW
jgi:hypothetical protein